MYSSPQAVGPIAIIEYEVVDIINEYFERHPWLEAESEEDVETLYQYVLKEINIKYLRKVVRWRLEELNEKKNNNECDDEIYFKSKNKLFERIPIDDKETYNTIYVENERESDLLVNMSNIVGLKTNDDVKITVERIEDNEFNIAFSFNEKVVMFWLSLHDKQQDNYYIYIYGIINDDDN